MRGEAKRPIELIVPPPAAAADDQITKDQRLRQRELVLSYNAFRTMLGRAPTSGAPGAAVVFIATRVNYEGQPDARGNWINIEGPAPFAAVEDGWTLVVITTANQTLRAPLHHHGVPTPVQVKQLRAGVEIGRLQIRDENDDPIYLGVVPATQTHNVERHRRAQHAGEGAAPVEQGDDAPRRPRGRATADRVPNLEAR